MYLAVKKNKKGISPIIGYVLLISFVIAMSTIVYQQLKTYVPKDALECPEGVSFFIKESDCNNSQITLTIQNTGRFAIGGYFIYGSNVADEDLATIDLSGNIRSGGRFLNPGVMFGNIQGSNNTFNPTNEETHKFNLTDTGLGQIHFIELLPLRWQTEEGIQRVVSCGHSKIKESFSDCQIQDSGEELPGGST